MKVMKNIHVLLVGESYLSLNCSYRDSAIGTEVRKPYWTYTKDWKHYMSVTDASVRPHNIYITNDEEIKVVDWITNGLAIMKANLDCQPTMDDYHPWKKIILTDNEDLINDGVQAIDDEFLEWFVKNPSCEWVEVTEYLDSGFSYGYKIIIPKEEPKKETTADYIDRHLVEAMIEVAKQDKNKYSEEEVKHLMTLAFEQGFKKADVVEAGLEAKETDTEVNWIFLKHKK